ncbi:hypothetical protein B0H17DRAFT_947276, partial [Mycena rosella]
AALEWLIATDQPIAAVNHPKFRVIINIAARATNGITIPRRNATREEIMTKWQVTCPSARRIGLNISVFVGGF